MDFYAVLDQVLELLRQRGRVTYNALKRQFDLARLEEAGTSCGWTHDLLALHQLMLPRWPEGALQSL